VQLFGQKLYDHTNKLSAGVKATDGDALADTVSAITSDPNFVAVLTAAITSYIVTVRALVSGGGDDNSCSKDSQV
jgi:hypothetical protein